VAQRLALCLTTKFTGVLRSVKKNVPQDKILATTAGRNPVYTDTIRSEQSGNEIGVWSRDDDIRVYNNKKSTGLQCTCSCVRLPKIGHKNY